MNLYIRYFDSETLVTNVEDAISFLSNIDEIGMDQQIADEVRSYYESDMRYPRRYKVRARIYFIMIKTDAASMQEFKANRNVSVNKAQQQESDSSLESSDQPSTLSRHRQEQNDVLEHLNYVQPGWYEGAVDFKRVVTNPQTGKNEYRDCHFVARCKSFSGMDCYNRIIEHLRERVDKRSQFPSVKGKNFRFQYLGAVKTK